MMSLEMKCRVLKNLTALLCVLCFPMIPGENEVEFNLGKNVTLDFHQLLESQDSKYFLVIHLDAFPNNPFYEDDQLDPSGLKPGQAGRVDVKEEQHQRNVIITISIQDVQPIDEGLYIVNIIQWNGNRSSPHTYQTFLDVTYPPGIAACHIQNPPNPSGDWLALRCNATVAIDNTENLMCYQNSKQVPYIERVKRIGSFTTGLFWIDSTLQVRCCLTSSDVDMESCRDFVRLSSDDDTDQNNGKCGECRVATVTLGLLFGAACIAFLVAAVYVYRKHKNNRDSSSNGTGEPWDAESSCDGIVDGSSRSTHHVLQLGN